MIVEDNELLLKDLSARLRYGVIVDYAYNAFDVHKGNYVKHGSKCILKCYLLDVFMSPRQNEEGEYIKPYLRPMSSMTEEEKKEFDEITLIHTPWGVQMDRIPKLVDWLNKKMFDYHCLIEKGLALEAPEGMYEK